MPAVGVEVTLDALARMSAFIIAESGDQPTAKDLFNDLLGAALARERARRNLGLVLNWPAMRGNRELVSLYHAFDLLIYSSRPKAVVPVLRHAIAMLAEQNAVETPRLRRALSTTPLHRNDATAHPDRQENSGSNWEQLRPRLHSIVAGSGAAERAAVAAQLGISPSTLRGIVSTTVPGAGVIARTAEWLRAREAPANSGGCPPAFNGRVGHDGSNPKTAKLPPPAPAEEAEPDAAPGKAVAARAAQWLAARQAGAISTDVATAPAEPETVNGADSAAACHLTSQMCDQLNFLIQTDPRAVRQSGVRLETARHAALGGAVEPPIAERLVKFLEAG
jgi:hypothetical protein